MDLYIVTGASRGLGKSIVEIALRNNHQVLAVSRTSMAQQINLTGLTHRVDDFEEFPMLFENALGDYQPNDFEAIHLINNAGVVEPVGYTENLDLMSLKKNIDINLIAPIMLSAQFLKWSANFEGWRTIVNISSGVAEKPKATWSAYSAAKGGLKNFSHALADELKASPKSRVVCFNPGVMDTTMQDFIRQQSPATFPDVERFRSFKEKGQLRSPDRVAARLFEVLQKPEQISKVDINIEELVAGQ